MAERITREEMKAIGAVLRVSEARRKAEGRPHIPLEHIATDAQIDFAYDEFGIPEDAIFIEEEPPHTPLDREDD